MQGRWIPSTIDDVLFIEGAANLFSEGVLAAKGYTIVRKADETKYIQSDGIEGPTAIKKDGLYLMQFKKFADEQILFAKNSRAELWHYRCSHINMQYLRNSVEILPLKNVISWLRFTMFNSFF